MIETLRNLLLELDIDGCRFRRPSPFLFFCGGVMDETASGARSLRRYLLAEANFEDTLSAHVVLAERANQLYRDTKYPDLISFEEDIAKISSLVLVIAESPGSLAELGAFSSNQIILPFVSIIMQEKYAKSESFIRYGPVERIKKREGRVGFFPWETNDTGHIEAQTVAPYCEDIHSFIEDLLDQSPKTLIMSKHADLREFAVIIWIIYVSVAIPVGRIKELMEIFGLSRKNDEIKDKIYCMELAGWIASFPYSSVDYFYCCYDIDPLEYTFKKSVRRKDPIRYKMALSKAIDDYLQIKAHIRERAQSYRRSDDLNTTS